MISVLVTGTGRMGKMIMELIENDERFTLAGSIGHDNCNTLADTAPADVVIDFSNKAMLPLLCEYVKRTGTPLVCGTTGFTDEDMQQLQQLGEHAPVLYSANYSVGVAVLRKLAAVAAQALGNDFNIEIIETHHNQKADAPSGTAKLLLNAVDPKHTFDVVHGREGITGKRSPREIGVHAVRGGTVAGKHTVAFFGADEEIELTHLASSRRIFAAGALKAAANLINRPSGFYSIDDILFSQGETP